MSKDTKEVFWMVAALILMAAGIFLYLIASGTN